MTWRLTRVIHIYIEALVTNTNNFKALTLLERIGGDRLDASVVAFQDTHLLKQLVYKRSLLLTGILVVAWTKSNISTKSHITLARKQ